MTTGQIWRVKIRSPVSKRWYTATVCVEAYREASDSYTFSITVKRSFLYFFEARVKLMRLSVQTKDIQWLEKLA
jgi:hypothetical protein